MVPVIQADNLMQTLKSYARVDDETKEKKQIAVGVVGFPNVGKSSIINSLKRCRAVAVGKTPGVTKSMQEIKLDKNILLLDSPGVLTTTQDQADSLILRSAARVEDIADPTKTIDALLKRIEKN